MTLNLVRRSTKGSPLTAVDHDGNLDKIEQAIEGIEPTPGTDLGYTPSTRLLSSSTGQDVTLPLAGTDAGLLAGVSFTAPSGWTASGSVANGTITLSLALPAGSSLVASGDRTAWDTAYAERLRWDGGSTGLNASTARTSLGLGTAATTDASAYATAAQGAKADTAIQPGNAALSDAREWSAETISQAEAEAGSATTRRAFTAQRVFQAAAAWWAGSAAKTKLDGIASGATANATDAQLRDRSTHTGTQPAGTITGLATVATSGSYSDLSNRPTLGTFAAANAATPPAIGGTTPAAGAFTDLLASTTLVLPGAAPSVPAAGHVYRSTNTLSYRDSTGAERLILNAQDNLANLADAAVARSNLGAASTAVVTTSTAGLARATGYGSISYAAQVTLDFSALTGQMNTISLTGALELLTSNLANGREVRLRLVCDSTQRTLTFPADWKFVGTKPANIAASKVAVLSLAAFGTTNADVVAAFAVQS